MNRLRNSKGQFIVRDLGEQGYWLAVTRAQQYYDTKQKKNEDLTFWLVVVLQVVIIWIGAHYA
jgi:hypothetical protein